MTPIVMRRYVLWLFPVIVFAGALRRIYSVPVLEPAGAGDPAAHERVVRAMREAEPGFRRIAFENYPGNLWAQDVDFARQELFLVDRLARDEHMRVGAVLDVIDRDVKRADGTTTLQDRGRANPCMPLPFYD